jgi:hypothetical protein
MSLFGHASNKSSSIQARRTGSSGNGPRINSTLWRRPIKLSSIDCGVPAAKELRKTRASANVKFFVWLAILDRCWTAERRHRHHLQVTLIATSAANLLSPFTTYFLVASTPGRFGPGIFFVRSSCSTSALRRTLPWRHGGWPAAGRCRRNVGEDLTPR